jgi:soluble lytic murein transglycosylase-like protein
VTLRQASAWPWALAVAAALLLVAPVARADIWAYLDEQGVAHFAAEQVDERYHLFYRETRLATGAASRAPDPDLGGSVQSAAAEYQRRGAWLERLPHFRSVLGLLQEASSRHNLDAHLLTALVATESGFNPQAVSDKGALGLMQLLPETALRYGVAIDAPDAPRRRLFDPALNVSTGARHLRDLLNQFDGKLELALAAYNAGAGAVLRAGSQIPAFRETQNYVRTVLGLYAALRPPVPVPAMVPPEAAATPLPPLGGALGRGNMVAPLGAVPRLADPRSEPGNTDP